MLRLYRPLQRWLIKRADVIVGTTPVYVQQSPFLQHVQEIFGNAQVFFRMADMQRPPVLAVAKNVVGIGNNCRELGNQQDRLPHQVFGRGVVGVWVEIIHFEHRPREDIHNILSFEVDYIHLRFLLKRSVLGNYFTELR